MLSLAGVLAPDEAIFVLSGLIPNRKSHPLIHRWFGVVFRGGQFQKIEDFEALLACTGLGRRPFPNRGVEIATDALTQLLPEAVRQARRWMGECRRTFETEVCIKIDAHLEALMRLRGRQHRQIEIRFGDNRQPERLLEARKAARRREIDRLFDDYQQWILDTLTTEDQPYIQVVAVLKGDG